MLRNNYFARLHTLLFEKGISFRQSNRLVEEIQDHLTLSMAEFQKQGNDLVKAERLALKLVGSPETIAERASADLQGGWVMRCAWLLCSGGFFLGGIGSVFAIMLLGYYFSGMYAYYNGGGVVNLSLVQVEVVLLNWLPLLIGMAVLHFLIRFSSVD